MGAVPQTLGQHLHELCNSLRCLSECCRAVDGPWAPVGDTLGALSEMMTEGSPTEWADFLAHLREPVPQQVEVGILQSAEDSVLVATPAVDELPVAEAPTQPFASEAAGTMQAEDPAWSQPFETMVNTSSGGVVEGVVARSNGVDADGNIALDALVAELTSPSKRPEHSLPTTLKDASSPSAAQSSSPVPTTMGGGDAGCSGASAADVQSIVGEHEHEALRILRQVEAEVRTLKKWYTEAIEAMRAPPFPAWSHHHHQSVNSPGSGHSGVVVS